MRHESDLEQDALPVLAVDLDGTLIRSDMLHESFWSAFGRNWRTPGIAASALMHGKAALKARLGAMADVDVTTLPYNPEVITRIEDWRAKGGRTVLVTATDQAVADRIAAHLGLFDEVHGSDGVRNLKAANKAEFLSDRFGKNGFAYMGDSPADVPVWKASALAITVDAPAALRDKAERTAPQAQHLGYAKRGLRPYIRALRPHQWLKNILIFVPMLAAHQLTLSAAMLSLMAFVSFSLLASAVYVLNDLYDLKSDRAHPRKRNRPFASGAVPLAHGGMMAVGLVATGLILSIPLGAMFAQVLLVYFATTTLYSLYFKQKAILDVCVLAGLYTIRILAGGVATGIELSVWLLAFAIFFFFALAAVKRQAELVDTRDRGKLLIAGRGYRVDDLALVSQMATSSGYVSVMVLALYLNSAEVQLQYSSPHFLWGICLIMLYWISRIVLVTHRGRMLDDPVVFAAKDRVSQISLVVIVALAMAGVWL